MTLALATSGYLGDGDFTFNLPPAPPIGAAALTGLDVPPAPPGGMATVSNTPPAPPAGSAEEL